MPSWSMCDPKQAHAQAVVVGFDDRGISSDSRELFRDALQRWVQALYEIKRDELLSATVRQASAEYAAQELLARAQSTQQPCLGVELIEGEYLILAREDILRALGAQRIVEAAHREALERAKESGRPYNAQALRVYAESELEPTI